MRTCQRNAKYWSRILQIVSMSEDMSEQMSESMSKKRSDCVSEYMSGYSSEYIYICDVCIKNMFFGHTEYLSNDMVMFHVMVGITRTKGILMSRFKTTHPGSWTLLDSRNQSNGKQKYKRIRSISRHVYKII